MSNWKAAVTVAPALKAIAATGQQDGDVTLVNALREAAKVYDARRDPFAEGKADTCRDIANRVSTLGFASDRQRDYAAKLVVWAQPRVASPAAAPAAPVLTMSKLFEVMQKHATLHADKLKISRKNGDSLCWLVWQGQLVGKIEDAVVTVWRTKAGTAYSAIMALLAEFDSAPLAAAQKHGRLSGRCCSCGRDLTDPASIAAGIGPYCAARF